MPPEEIYDIFVSYSSKDQAVVMEYIDMLRAKGYRIWYDAHIKGGHAFQEVIVQAIKQSRLMVFFSSKNSNNPKCWAISEMLAAKELEKSILPVRIDDSGYSDNIKLALIALQYVTITGKGGHDRLFEAVRGLIGEPTSTPSPSSPTAPQRRHAWPIAACATVFTLAYVWLLKEVSGEHPINPSLSYLAMTVSAAVGLLLAAYFVFYEQRWNDRHPLLNLTLTLSLIFFVCYVTMSGGLSYAGRSIAAINLPSTFFALLAVVALLLLASFRRFGYWLLWLCAAAMTAGSYWWVQGLTSPMSRWHVAAAFGMAALTGMALLTIALRLPHGDTSAWQRLT